MDNDLSRLKLLSRGISYAFLVLVVLMVPSAAFMYLMVAIALIEPWNVEITNELDIPLSPEQLIMLVLMMAVILTVASAVLINFMMITRGISKEYSPFTKKNVKSLRLLAILMLVVPFVIMALSAIVEAPSVWDCITMAIPGVFSAAIFYMMALIFDYGCWLQKESDETL